MREPGRLALVTGAATGIGEAIARRLAFDGFRVVVADRDGARAAYVAEDIGGDGIELDVTDVYAVAEAIEALGTVSVLVNNVGKDQHAFFGKTSPADWRDLIAVNLESVLATTHAVLPRMRVDRFGRIINIGSVAGAQGSRGGAVYAAAKGGVVAFTKSIARENADCAITANVVSPGPIRTEMFDRAVQAGGEALAQAMASATLLKRAGTPQDVAAAVAFLASEGAGFITGEDLSVSGGMGC